MRASDRSMKWLVVGPVVLYAGLPLLGPLVAVVTVRIAGAPGNSAATMSGLPSADALSTTISS